LEECENDLVEHFVALSYVWGDSSQKGSISINGKTLAITASLALALRHVRDPKRVLRIWADGICINQMSIHDRNTQVSIMGTIYATAQHTIIFLGPSNSKYDLFLRPSPSSIGPDKTDTEALEKISDEVLEYPWFTRVWILQELVLSPDPRVQIGRVCVRWNVFSKHISKAGKESTSTNRKNLQDMCRIRSEYQAQIHLGTRPDASITMLDILRGRRGLGATDPKDMVYAHIGIAEPQVRSDIIVDYSKSKAQVYEEIARYIYKNTCGFTILILVENLNLQSRSGLPTWVPDWSVKPDPAQANWLRHIKPDENPRGNPPAISSTELPGVLVIAGNHSGTVRYILSTELLPSYQECSRSEHKAIWDWMFDPQGRELIHFLIAYYGFHYQHFRETWDDELMEPSKKQEKDRMKTYLQSKPERISELFGSLLPAPQKMLEDKSADPIVLLGIVAEHISYIIFDVLRRSSAGTKISFVLDFTSVYVYMCCLPVQARVGDIISMFTLLPMTPLERSYNVFLAHIFRPDEQKYGSEYKEGIRRSLEIDSIPDDLKHSKIECCEYISRIESDAIYDDNPISDFFDSQRVNFVLFAVH
jgi:hypothetical protein